MSVEGMDEFPASKLRSAVGVDDAAGDIVTVGVASGDGVVDRSDGRRDFIRESME